MLKGLKRHTKRMLARAHFSGVIVLALTIGLLFWNLWGWTAGMSAEEAGFVSSHSGHDLITNPINLPVRALQFIFDNLGWHSLFAMRFASALFGLILVAASYKAGKMIFGRHVAISGTALLIATPWFLIASRQASGYELLLYPVILIYILLLLRAEATSLRWWLFCGLLAIGMYIPGVFWVSLGLMWVFRHTLATVKQKVSTSNYSFGWLIFICLLGPLVYALIKDWELVKPLVLFPQHFAPAIDTLKNIGWSAAGLFWRTGQHFSLSVGNWPLLNAVQLILVVFGLYATRSKAKRLFYGGIALVVFAVLVSGLNANYTLLLLALPALAMYMKAGLRYLYLEWRTIFPRNPIPQAVAIILIAVVTIAQLWFAWRYTLDAWPHTPETKAAYMIK